jgi:hypothetical protein
MITGEKERKRSATAHATTSAATFRVCYQCMSVVSHRHPADALLLPFFEKGVIGKFNKCAMSNMTCVLQKKDDSSYPIPPNDRLVQFFDTKRNAVQEFVQDPENPAHLINHDYNYLHYQDDWYILAYALDGNKEGTPLHIRVMPWQE